MRKQPRKLREVKRAADTQSEHVAGRIVASRPDLRQAGLFDLTCKPTLVRSAPSGPNWLHEIKITPRAIPA
jgi:bifunctional non-homologous end joining protein LigD